MFILSLLILLAALSVSCKLGEQQQKVQPKLLNTVSEHGQLSIKGTHIVDQNGQVVQLRGMSLYWSQWQGRYYTPEVVNWLKEDWGCTVIRAAMAVDHGGYLENPKLKLLR